MLLVALTLLQAATLPQSCRGEGVDSLPLPLRHGAVESPTFTYRYQVVPAQGNENAPVVIVLPGGPGQASIGTASGSLSLGAVPGTVNRIFTDPRGAGCNAHEPLADSAALSTESIARDVMEVIRHRKLDNYYLYGASYGTVVATQLASLIEREQITRPRAVILEGVVGRAFQNFDEYMAAFTREWERVKPTLPDGWGDRLSRDTLPYGYSPHQWGTFISASLILGDLPISPYNGPLLNWALPRVERYHRLRKANALSLLTTEDSLGMAFVESRMGIYGNFARKPTEPSRTTMFTAIACDELWGSWRYGRVIRNGRLIADGVNVCGSQKTHAYDSRAHQVTVPLYYFQGPHDPTSTLSSAQYHFVNQELAPRTFVLVDGASHAPLTGGLRQCAQAVWAAILDNTELETALRGCPRKAEVMRAAPVR